MRFAFTDDQLAFAEAVRDLLTKECAPEQVRVAWSREDGRIPGLWSKLAEMGLLGLLAPEGVGGLGMTEIDLVLLEGAINALGKVGLMLNVHQKNLRAVLDVLPALKRPTISHLSDDEWLAVNTILDETTVRDIIPRLKQAGGEGIVEYPLNKIVL